VSHQGKGAEQSTARGTIARSAGVLDAPWADDENLHGAGWPQGLNLAADHDEERNVFVPTSANISPRASVRRRPRPAMRAI
jgi:hypothetical protein